LLASDQVAINQASFQGPALKGWDLKQILPTLTKRATDFIATHAKDKQPFLLYFPLTSPHTPLAVTNEWKNKSGLNNAYADFVVQTDDVVGRVLDQLTVSGVEDNTVVIFLSDNGCGAYIGVKDLAAQGHKVSGPLRGYKGDVWEGGHRTPFIIRYPGVTKPGSVCDELVHQADIMATLSEIFNTRIPDNAGEDSFSLLPLLKGSLNPIRESAIVCRWDGLQAIRYGKWKLVFNPEPELYNLENDIGETKNLAAENRELVIKMSAMRKKMVTDGRSTSGPAQQNDVEVKL
jgi:arylsulfatase A-like enzyme